MFVFGLIVGALLGGGAGWGITYLYFRGINKKLEAKIAAEIKKV